MLDVVIVESLVKMVNCAVWGEAVGAQVMGYALRVV